MRIKGSGEYTDAKGHSRRIIGRSELSDGENLQELKVSGNVSFSRMSCNNISVSGKCEGGNILAQNLKVSGEILFDDISCDRINISGTCDGKAIKTNNALVSGKMKIDSLKVEETLKLSGRVQIDSITADEIFIGSRNGFLNEIKCKRLKIFEHSKQFGIEMFGNLFDEDNSRVQIKSIEAQSVELENCLVDVIKCQNALIGENCAIKKIYVAGECKVTADSTVDDIVHM